MRVAVLMLLAIATLAVACDEGRANKLYDRALGHVEKEEFQEAVARFEEVIDEYPDTAAAARAREQIELYRGLDAAVDYYGSRKVYDQMILTARAIYRFEDRRGRWPGSLAELAPGFLREPAIDPWGRELRYAPKGRRGYVLGCYGSDGNPGGDGEARDWFIEDGRFVRTPSVPLP